MTTNVEVSWKAEHFLTPNFQQLVLKFTGWQRIAQRLRNAEKDEYAKNSRVPFERNTPASGWREKKFQ